MQMEVMGREEVIRREQSVQGTSCEVLDSSVGSLTDELDWGAEGSKEVAHVQRSSSIDGTLNKEIESLKKQLIESEKEKNSLANEVQAAKIKSGKLLQKVKALQTKNENLQKEVTKLKAKKSGLSDLDQALEDEYKAQVTQAHSERNELKQRLEEVLKEKDHLGSQCEVLKDAQDRLLEMKEKQDSHIKGLLVDKRELQSSTGSMEWRITELEEALEEKGGAQISSDVFSSSPDQLKVRIVSLESQMDELSSINLKLESVNKDLQERVDELSSANGNLKDQRDVLSSNVNKEDASRYKEAFIQQQEQFDMLLEEKASLESQLQEALYNSRRFEQEVIDIYETFDETKRANLNLTATNSTLDEERLRLQSECVRLTQFVSDLKDMDEGSSLALLIQENESLRKQFEELHAENNDTKTELKKLEMEVESKDEKLEETLMTVGETKRMLQQFERERRTFDQQLSNCDKKWRYSDAESNAHQNRVHQLNQELMLNRQQLEGLSNQVEHWRKQCQHLNKQVETADASLTRLSSSPPVGGGAAELEAALASLHLRDLRCHQLIMEINKLVEERDALQLRLSSSLRTNQEMKNFKQELQADGQQTHNVPLKNKLEELRELNEVVEQKTRANVPLVPSLSGGLPPSPFSSPNAPPTPSPDDAPHLGSMGEESQGASSGLMDWILGRSTPSVVDI